jgi:hypothetical protein
MQPGDPNAQMPWLFGRGMREAVLAALAVAGPLFLYEIRESLGNREVGKDNARLQPLIDAGVILMAKQPGFRQYVSLNTGHPWYRDFLSLGKALAAVGKPRILIAGRRRPPRLKTTIKPTWENTKNLLGSPGRTAVTVALLTPGNSADMERRTGVTSKQVQSVLHRLIEQRIVDVVGDVVRLRPRWKLFDPLHKILQRVARIAPVRPTSHQRDPEDWDVPIVFGTRVRTKIISLLALNGPSDYGELVRALNITRASAYCDLGLLERMGIVRSWTCRASGRRCFGLDSRFVASRELLQLGQRIAIGNSAREWRAASDLQPAEPLGYNGGAKRPWLFKRNWKTKILLLVHASGQLTYGELAIAIGSTHEAAARAAQYLLDDGLLLQKKFGRFIAVAPNLRGHPCGRELQALVQVLLRKKYPEIAGISRALPGVTAPKSLYG